MNLERLPGCKLMPTVRHERCLAIDLCSPRPRETSHIDVLCGLEDQRLPKRCRGGSRHPSAGMFGEMQSDVCARSAQQVLPEAKRRGGQFRRRGADSLLPQRPEPYSHSIVAGGFEEMSSATRLTSRISLIMRLETRSRRSYGSRAQSAVIASSEVTARITIG